MIKNNVFGEMTFSVGWKSKTEITLFDCTFSVVVKANAYSENDGITPEQEKAFEDFTRNKIEKLKSAEKLLNDRTNSEAPRRFVPQRLLFQRDGEYVLLLDDRDDPDNGMAVVLSPKPKLLTQDEYL